MDIQPTEPGGTRCISLHWCVSLAYPGRVLLAERLNLAKRNETDQNEPEQTKTAEVNGRSWPVNIRITGTLPFQLRHLTSYIQPPKQTQTHFLTELRKIPDT